MNRSKYPIFPFLFLLLLSSGYSGLLAQIVSPQDVSKLPASYPSAPEKVDTVRVFCSPGDNGLPVTGSLTAIAEHGVPGWDFVWSRLDTISFVYVPFFTENGVSSSTVVDLESGGYRVRVTDGNAEDSIYDVWVYVRNLEVTAGVRNYTCEYLALRGEVLADVFRYFDPADQTPLTLSNPTSFLWTSTPTSIIPGASNDLFPVTYAPPTVDTEYYLTVQDEAGCMQTTDFFFESPFPKATFSVDFSFDNQNRASAPLDVYFTNSSENAVSFNWKLGDGKDTSSNSFNVPESYTYYSPGTYRIVLTATSEEGCQASDSLEIAVDNSLLNVPNVFTPNEDTHNDYFLVDHVSLRLLQVQVFNRNGMKVYEFYGDSNALKDWKGWDGKIQGTNRYASPGVYPYVIKAFGWDDETYVMNGMVYLFR